ncbi:MAG: ATP-binding protein [Candidatus Electryonea clarkiae]|nr:ATP-binding protein [Candidatus Electryonea clarkiae]MDP8286964.1 ATP-binding protein [Candidatus Electryonea clarkiae]
MNPFNSFSIKNKLIAIILTVTFLTTGIGFALVVINEINHMKEDLIEKSNLTAKMMGEYCVAPIVFNDVDGIQEILKKINSLPNVITASVYDVNGALMTSYRKNDDLKIHEMLKQNVKATFKGDYLHFHRSIDNNGENIGTIGLFVSTTQMEKEIYSSIQTMLLLLACLITLSYFLATSFQKIISKPINSLRMVTKSISSSVDYSIRATKTTNDEIGGLYDDFNDLIEQIQFQQEAKDKAEEKLREHSVNLENEVQKRTIDLSKQMEEVEQLNQAMLNLMEDQRITNETLSTTSHQLRETNKELEAFAYSVSHDLRAPLRAIDGFAEMLFEDYGEKLDAEGQHQIDVIQQSARSMGALIDGLLKFSRLGRKGLHYSRIEMFDLVKDVLEQIKLTSSGIKIDLRMTDLLPANGDRTLIKEVLANLLSNAVKYSKQDDSIPITIGSRTEKTENVYFVKDNGVGFDMKYVDKLFKVFQRLHKPADYEGTGIGLALVQRIIYRHGGRVWAEGIVNEGATFYFTLPKEKDA